MNDDTDRKRAPATNGGSSFDTGKIRVAEKAMNEAWGASQIGPFDYVPPLGFREYWYPAIEAKYIKPGKTKAVRMLGEDIVLFRSRDGGVAAITDWCPHRGARFSLGVCEFPGTVTCPYHGYTFDESGQCVAGLIDAPDSPVVPKMRAKSYPTGVHSGIVFVWMGETDPVPLEEDLPEEFLDPRNHFLHRTKFWDTNWTEAVNQGIDYHAAYLHRADIRHFGGLRFKFHPLFSKNFGFFRPKLAYNGGARITIEEDRFIGTNPKDPHVGDAYHPGVDAKWPQSTWWRVLKPSRGRRGGNSPPTLLGKPQFQYSVELPSRVRIGGGSEKTSCYMRWMVPVDFEGTMTWTLLIGRKPKTPLGMAFKYLWYFLWRKPAQIIRINEWEDLVVFKKGRLRYDIPQKLGPLDAVVIYFRRHLAQRSRDFRRLGGTVGSLKAEPVRTGDEWRKLSKQEQEQEALRRLEASLESPAESEALEAEAALASGS